MDPKTPATLAAALLASVESARGAPFIPGALRDGLAAAAEFAQLTAQALEEAAAALDRAQAAHNEQAAQIEALQASQLAAHAEVLARLDALEKAQPQA